MTMDQDALLPYHKWILRGRTIKRGQRAAFYLMSPDYTQRLALFSEDQTEALKDHEHEDWTEILTAEEAKLDKPPKKPKVILYQEHPDAPLYVWCGANKKVIADLQKANYDYNPNTHKWTAPHKDVERATVGFEYRGLFVDNRTGPEL